MDSIKKRFAKTSKKLLFGWVLVLLLALVLRVWGLNLNPVGISHDDELNEILNAKSVAIAGIPRPGFVAGVLTQNDKCKFVGDCVYGEIGTYIQVPFMAVFPLGLALSRIFFVITSLGIVFLVGKLFENFSKNIAVGILAGLFVAINPWAIYFGRTAHTILASHLFYLLAAYLFTRTKSYKSNLVLGSLAAFVASLVYFGSKAILPLMLVWGTFYNIYQFGTRNIKFTALVGLISVVLIAGYMFALSNSYAGKRLADVTATAQETRKAIELGGSVSWVISRQVDKIIPRINSFFGFFSVSSLFLTGQQAQDGYYLSGHGYFYLIDFVFLIFGIVAMSTKLRKGVFVLLLVAVAISPVAIKISETSAYSHRASLAYPILAGIVAWGVYFVWTRINEFGTKSKLKRFSLSKIFLVLTTGIYALSLSYFMFVYWYRTPIEQSTRWFFHERVLSSYIKRVMEAGDKKIVILSARPDGIFNSFVFYSGIYNTKENIKEVNKLYEDHNYVYKSVSFLDDCTKLTKENTDQSVIFVDQINNPNCNLDLAKTHGISNPQDAGVIYKILNDSLCAKYPINKYPYPKTIKDFNVEVQTNEVFCAKWISNPDGK